LDIEGAEGIFSRVFHCSWVLLFYKAIFADRLRIVIDAHWEESQLCCSDCSLLMLAAAMGRASTLFAGAL
jgi:hypothetical protein